MNRFSLKNFVFRVVQGFVTVAALAAIWQATISLYELPEYLLPTPLAVLQSLRIDSHYYLTHSFVTVAEACCGFLLATTIGILLGSLFGTSRLLERLALPYFVGLQAVPIIGVAPLIVLWVGSGRESKIVMAALLCLFPVVVSTARGLRLTTRNEQQLMRIYGATPWQTFRKLRFPKAVGSILSGLRVSASLAMIGAIVAEYAGADEGIGYMITQASYRMETAQLFAGIFCSVGGTLILYLFVILVELTVLRRYSPIHEP